MIRVVPADDEQLVRTGFRMILGAESDIEVVGDTGDGQSAVSTVVRERPDVVLMDIRMPVMDGLAATAARAGHPDLATKVIVLTNVRRRRVRL